MSTAPERLAILVRSVFGELSRPIHDASRATQSNPLARLLEDLSTGAGEAGKVEQGAHRQPGNADLSSSTTAQHVEDMRTCLVEMLSGKKLNGFGATLDPESLVAVDRAELAPDHVFQKIPGKIFSASFPQPLSGGHVLWGHTLILVGPADANKNFNVLFALDRMRESDVVMKNIDDIFENTPGARRGFSTKSEPLVNSGRRPDPSRSYSAERLLRAGKWFQGDSLIQSINYENFQYSIPKDTGMRTLNMLKYPPNVLLTIIHFKQALVDGPPFIVQCK